MPREKKFKIELEKLLIVEGDEEIHFFQALIDHLGLSGIQLFTYQGKNRLRDFIESLPLEPNFTNLNSIGIERDANSDYKAAMQSVQGALKNVKLPVPRSTLISVGDKPKVTIMLMPGNNRNGMLEDLCLESVKGDPAMKCLDKYFECLKEKLKTQPKNMSKARIHAFLASREEPDKRLGEAAKAEYWNWDSKAFDEVKAFLKMI